MPDRNTDVDALLEEGFRVQRTVPQTEDSRKRSFQLINAAANLGSTTAMAWCAEAYTLGFGTKSNPKKARTIATKASELGNPRAKYLLADMMIRDRKDLDSETAYQLALDALRGGEDDADFMVAWMLYRGHGVEQNKESAIAKIQSLANLGDQRASKFLEDIRATG